MYRVPDNYDAYKRHEAEQAREVKKLPVCDYCDEPITSDHLYDIDGTLICPDCMESVFRKSTDRYVTAQDDDWDGSEDDLPW